MAGVPNPNDELMLLERVFLRIGSAETDEQLESMVSKFLPPVLLKLSSTHEEVKKKVLELLTHISKRIKARPHIQLPVKSLLDLYQDPNSNSFIVNFAIIYIKIGFPRLPPASQAELLQVLLKALSGKVTAHQDSLLLLVTSALYHLDLSHSKEKQNEPLFETIRANPTLRKLLFEFLLDVLVMPYGFNFEGTAPPGMSIVTYKRVMADGIIDSPDTLEKIKCGVLKFVSNKILPEPESFCLYVVAAADTRHNVASDGDLELRRIIGGIDWSNAELVAPLYTLYLGVKTNELERRKLGANIRLRMKILPYLSRCRGSAVIWPTAIQVLFDSLYGENTISKLKALALQFARVIIQQVDANHLKSVGPVLLKSGFLQLLTDENFEQSARQHVYSIIGHLVNKVPTLIQKDLSLIDQFFKALSTEELPDVQISIRESLLTMSASFTNLDSELSGKLLSVLTTQMESQNPMARLVVARYLSCVYNASHAESRYLLLLASGDVKDDVSNEAFKALYGPSYQRLSNAQDLENVNFEVPHFPDLINLIAEKASQRETDPNLRTILRNNILPFNVKTFVEILNYLSVCLTRSAGAKCRSHPNDDTSLIGAYLSNLQATEPAILQHYLKLINQLLNTEKDVVALRCLVETVSIVPHLLGSEFSTKLSWMEGLLSHTREDIRTAAASLLGAVSSHTQSNDELSLTCTSLLNTLQETSSFVVEQQHGTLLSLASIVERRSFRQASNPSPGNELPSALHKSVALSTVEFLSHSQPLLMSAACSAIGQIGRVLPLPFSDDVTKDIANPGKLDVVNKLEEIFNSSNITTKIKERAVESLGLLCLSTGFPHRKLIIEKLISKAKMNKEIEIHLEAGFALVNCVLGPYSPQARDFWSETESDFKVKHLSVDQQTLDLLQWVLTEILDNIVPVVHPHSRQASCIWLLTLFKRCHHLDPVSQSLVRIQSAFMDFLSDNNDIIQDFASKGLAIVYEAGPEDMKKELVSLLVQQLVEGRKTAPKVTQDTKIFEEGLITTPSGGNLSTYKELCALASETNQPDLVYKFMHLVNHKAIWDSKKGAAFGFSSIIKSAGDDLTPYLSKIIPKLYRYQFDPVPKIQTSMASIWSAIVPETTKTIDLYHKEIFADLISNVTSGQWRVRLSCCVALADFLRGGGAKVFDDCVPQFAELWRQIFRVMDDVHEGTRHAAVTTGKTLATICVRHLEVGGKAGRVLVETILPVLLDQGVYSSVQEVVKLSLETISKIVGTCGEILKPHLTKLIPALLQATGELESPLLSYVSVRSGTDSNRQEVIDSARASAAKSHYTTETVTRCVPFVTEDLLTDMLPRLIELLGNNIGLGAKVATAHFFVLLAHQMQPAELQPYSGKILRVLLSGLTDRNSTLRKTYAQTIGHVIRSAKDSSVDKLFEKLNTSYLEKEDEGVRTAIGQTLQAICRQNQELVRARPDTIVPLVLFAMHMNKKKDDPQSMAHAEMWEDVWHEVAPGTEIMLNRHIESVCSLLAQTLQSPSWNMKAQAARAICTVASKVGNNLEDKHFVNLVNILVNGLAGRTWEGKEYLLDALAILCKNSRNLTSSVDMDAVTDSVLKECAKEQNMVYRQKALKALGQILQALEKDRFSQVYDLVQSILSKDFDSSDACDQEDRDQVSKSREEFLHLREIAFNVLGESWPLNQETQKKYQEQVALQCVQYMNNNTRQVQVSVMVALYSFVDKLLLLAEPPSEQQSKVLSHIHQAIDCAFSVGKHTRLRKESLGVLLLTLKKLRENKNQIAYKTFSQLFDKHSEELAKDTSPEVKSRYVDIKDQLSKN
uniref:Proteasome-associated protein ECM29 homolog n=1 Tax=Cacopsylla melanoneura TaxID=428564 RepID=A0A8D8X2I5_9HEMI